MSLPMNEGHQHAANADEHLAQGYLIPAAEEHYKAAEAYLAAVERSNDESAKRTMKMLYNEHCKAGKELDRKIAKLREEGRDPSLPQKPEPIHQQHHSSNIQSIPGDFPRSAPSPPPNRPMSDSQNTVDESFMILGGQRSDPGDAFNQFWTIMNGMLDNLSQPVAFATAPLGVGESALLTADGARRVLRRDGSDTSIEDPGTSRPTRKIGMKKPVASNTSKSPIEEEEFDEDIFDDGDELSESFCLIPSGSEPSQSALKKENATLKINLEEALMRVAAADRALQLRNDQDRQLRDSIVMARREAQRAMGASTIAVGQQRAAVDLSSLNIGIPVPGLNSGREAQYARRVRELEEDVRVLKTENERQKTMIVRYKEKWEKLKDAQKRKKEAKAAAEAASSKVRERIVEDPEGEQEL